MNSDYFVSTYIVMIILIVIIIILSIQLIGLRCGVNGGIGTIDSMDVTYLVNDMSVQI